MNYPNGKKEIVKNSLHSASRRGMSLENDINVTNDNYLNEGVANIHKKPTPITIVKVDYPSRRKARITEAYFKDPSTTDYNGIYKGKYIDFEAKECNSKTAFPFSSIHIHQINHLKDVLRHGAIAFLIMRMEQLETDYLIKADDFIAYYDSTSRKSLPIDWIKTNGYEISFSYKKPCNYLTVVDKVYKL